LSSNEQLPMIQRWLIEFGTTLSLHLSMKFWHNNYLAFTLCLYYLKVKKTHHLREVWAISQKGSNFERRYPNVENWIGWNWFFETNVENLDGTISSDTLLRKLQTMIPLFCHQLAFSIKRDLRLKTSESGRSKKT
jgi:hypothetical protein